MKRIRRKSIALLLLVTLLCAPQLVSRAADGVAVPLLIELCEPVYEGRRIGTEGNRLAAQLLAERLEAHALTPLEGHSDFLLPFEQAIAVINETMLALVMADGSREELVYGQDYIFTDAASGFGGTFPISLEAEKTDSSAVLFIDTAVEAMPQADAFGTMVFPADTLHFKSLGIIETGASSRRIEEFPRIIMLRPVYDRASGAAMLDMRYDFTKTVVTLHNAVGVLPGKDRTRAVILSAHFDGAGDQAGNRLPCALDNASGVAVVDLVLSQMAGTQPPCDVIFAFTNAEEAGLAGAHDLAKILSSQYEALYNINVDCVGVAGLPFEMQCPDAASVALYEKMGIYLSLGGFVSVPEAYGSSDHIAFIGAGIPSVALGAASMDVIHTVHDTADRIDIGVIRGIAGLITSFITENPDMHALLAQSHEGGATMADAPPLAYNEAVLQDDTLFTGSGRWITHAEALRHHPSLPLPQTFKGCAIEACRVELSTFDMPDTAPGQVVTLPDDSQNVMEITALYSDGVTSYRLGFNVYDIGDRYVRQRIGDEGLLLKRREGDEDVIEGVGLQQGDMSLYLFDGDASENLFEIDAGVFVHTRLSGTSKATVENASALLSDLDLTGLFEALIGFVQPERI